MAITNRDLDVSQQKDVYSGVVPILLGVGATHPMFQLPYPATLQSARAGAFGTSGSPQAIFRVSRFIVGSGFTSINLGISNLVLPAFGTSGTLAYSGLAPTGSTLLNLLAGDVLGVEVAGANSAIEKLVIEMVVRKTQDFVSHNGTAS